MIRVLAVILCSLTLASASAVAQEAPAITAFTGTLLRTPTTSVIYEVSLYRGDSADPNFDSARQLIATTYSDADGRFIIFAPNLPPDKALTIRAKNAALRLGGDYVVQPGATGFPLVTNDIRITPIPQSDPLFGIRNNNYATTLMYFVTDRESQGSSFLNTAATNENPSVGTFIAHVALGNGQAIPGKCGLASDWQCDGTPLMNDDAFIDKVSVVAVGSADAQTSLNRVLTKPIGNTILFFVHGFNNSFEQGASAASRLSYLMEPRPHTTLMYSWPSAGRVLGYTQDLKNAQLSAQANLIWVLDALASAPTHPSVILVAHSMGSYALTTALNSWALAHPNNNAVFSDLVLYAGDLDVDLWNQYSANIYRVVKRIKFYSNSNDQALHMSSCETGDHRLRIGQVTAWTSPIVGFDATPFASTDDFGHGYLVSSTSVAADWNSWIDGPVSPNTLSTLRRLAWLGDGGGGLIDTGKLTGLFVCNILTKISF